MDEGTVVTHIHGLFLGDADDVQVLPRTLCSGAGHSRTISFNGCLYCRR
jgi:hypothetical protein